MNFRETIEKSMLLDHLLAESIEGSKKVSSEVKGLAETVRQAKSSLARARASADKLARSAGDLGDTVSLVEAMTLDLDKANAELKSEMHGMTNGPPDEGAGS